MPSRLAGSAAIVLVPALLLTGCGGTSTPTAGSQRPTVVSPSPSASTSATVTPSITASSPPTTAPTAPLAGSADGLVTLHGNGFTMGLPHRATVSQETYPTAVGDVHAVLYTDTSARDGFIAALTDYPARHRITLDGAVSGVARTVAGTIRLDRTITFHGLPARQARIVGTNGGTPVTVFVLVVDVRSKLFQLEYIVAGKELQTAPAILTKVAYTITFD